MPIASSPRAVTLTFGAFGLALGIGVYFSTRTAPDGHGASVAKNRAAALGEAVAALGRIEPSSEIINLGAGVSSDRLDSLFVARGDRVQKGQVLGFLGGHAEQVAQLEMFRSQLSEAKLRLQTEVELSRTRIEAAETRRRRILEVSPLQIAAQEAIIAGLEANLANSQDILASHDQLYSRGFTSRRLQHDHKTLVMRGAADLSAARARLAELKQQFEVDKIDADVQVRLARAALKRAEAEFPLASLRKQVELANARAKQLTLYAPIDGRILNIKIKPGEQSGNGAILIMGNTDRMRAVAEVYETDVGAVKIGQHAIVTARVLSTPINGKVTRIGNMIYKNDILNIDPASRADARVVEVWIDLEHDVLLQRLTNLTVDVTIYTTSRSEPEAAGSGL